MTTGYVTLRDVSEGELARAGQVLERAGFSVDRVWSSGMPVAADVKRFVVLCTALRSSRVVPYGPYTRAEAYAVADVLRLAADGPSVGVEELRGEFV